MPSPRPLVRAVAHGALHGALAASALAQCALQWLPGDGIPGVGDRVYAATPWDPDGPGPAPVHLALGGAFTTAGTIHADHVVLWNPVTSTFTALGTGVSGVVRALAVAANGDLVVGGAFGSAGGTAISNIAAWNGTAWSSLGAGTNGEVRALLRTASGELVAGGSFTTAGGTAASYVARWNGASWSAMGSGLQQALPWFVGVNALALLANGDVVAGGSFSSAGSVPTSLVARWNGTSWSALGSGLPLSSADDTVQALTVDASGAIWAGGIFAGHSWYLARWNGTVWTQAATVTGGFNNVQVSSLATMPNGDVVAGGAFTAIGGVGVSHLARWNGSAWSGLGTGVGWLSSVGSFAPQVSALATMPNGDLVAGGNFTVAGGSSGVSVARWDGASWSPLANGIYQSVFTFVTMPNGDLVIGGDFLSCGSVAASRIARWDGTSWSSLGSGMNGRVNSLVVTPNGELVAGGQFTTAGGVNTAYVARWNGSAWTPLGSGLGFSVAKLLVLANGDVVAGGNFTTTAGAPANGIARWNGTTWSAFGSGVAPGSSVRTVAELPNGDLVAGGSFASMGGVAATNIARWDGSGWNPLGAGISGSVASLAVMPNGDLAATGWFATAGGAAADNVARWDGVAWSAMGTGIQGGSGFTGCSDITTLPNGDLAASCSYTFAAPGTATNAVFRWNGASWSVLAAPIDASVAALRMLPTGELGVAGSFVTAGSQVTGPFARLASACPAGAATFGAGCTGSAGLLTLSATSLPWIGSTYRAIATGVPPSSLAVGVFGIGAISVPLLTVLPTALPGCTLFATPDLLTVRIPSQGTAQDELALPDIAALIGQTLMHQIVPLTLDVTGSIVAVTSTNALALTIGGF